MGSFAFGWCSLLKSVYFEGNAPSGDGTAFSDDNNATVYYLPGTTGWGPTFGGCPTALWSAQPLLVTPGAATIFPSIQAGSVAEREFKVFNEGSVSLSGTASVSQPFAIAAGASYTLAPGQSQTVTVSYSPTLPGTDSG